MRIVYTRSHTVGSAFIRVATWSIWSHEAIVTPELTVIDASGEHGVSERPLRDLLSMSSEYEFRDIPCPNEAGALAFAREQLGKSYDWRALLGMGIRREWAHADKWFCSELVEASLAAGGRPRFRNHLGRITPQLSYMVL